MAQPEKLFTVDEANRALARVIPLVQQLQGLQDSIVKTNQQLDEATKKVSQGNGYPIKELRKQIEELTKHQLHLLEAFQSALQQLEGIGCVIKDLQQGLIDFYTMRNEELVFLCWRQGEKQIQFWHQVEDGFPGRQPIV